MAGRAYPRAAATAGIKAVVTDPAARNHPWISRARARQPCLIELDPSGRLTHPTPADDASMPNRCPPRRRTPRLRHVHLGSTGEPKAVAITHADVATLALDSAWDDGIGEAVLMHSPHAFDASTFEIWTPLLHGGRIIIPPAGALEADELRSCRDARQ